MVSMAETRDLLLEMFNAAVRAADPSTPCMVGATRFYNRNRLQALPDASGVLKDAVIYAFNFYNVYSDLPCSIPYSFLNSRS